MGEQGYDVFLVYKITSVCYFSGFLDNRDSVLALIVPADGEPVLMAYPISYDAASDESKACSLEKIAAGETLLGKIVDRLSALKAKRVGFDEMPAAFYLALTKKLGGIKLEEAPKLVWDLRRVKDLEEIACIRRSAKMSDAGISAAVDTVKVGMREYELAGEIEYAMRKAGSERPSFDIIVSSGPRTAYPHSFVSNRVIGKGDFVMLDIGAVYRGYFSDITRTLVMGRPNSKQAEIYRTVLSAHNAALEEVREGVQAKQVAEVARNIIAQKGYGDRFVHGLGHGVGLDIHEPPSLSLMSNETLKEGDIVTDEPAIYLHGMGGVRIENLLLVKKEGCERLTLSPIEEL